jgi:hypothetical protein
MSRNLPNPLQACFWLTRQERLLIIAVCALLMLGMAVRCLYLKNEPSEGYLPDGVEAVDTK